MAQDEERALLAAAAAGDAAEVARLIEDGADVAYHEEKEGTSALISAAKGGHRDAVSLLLDAGAPWNGLDRYSMCARDYAMNAGHQDVVDLLLDAGVRAELILGAASRSLSKGAEAPNAKYLRDRVEYSEDRLMDNESKGVMMAWEGALMEAHAHVVCSQGGDILNVGFGLGLVDKAIQRRNPKSHTIVEAHPDVYARMLAEGWDKKKGVQIIHARWQDVVDQLDQFDGIFFDTYGEYYDDFHSFHDCLQKLLRPEGVYSFFNGLCGDNAFFHVVYCQIVAMELGRIGFSVTFVPLPVHECLNDKIWEGVKLRYWQLDTYFLPMCTYCTTDESAEKGDPKINEG
eukprot:SM000304S11859  [mRNA]  locus=s304:123482:126140:- [translate_table: standard]